MDVVRDGGKVITVSGDRLEPERNIAVKQFEHHQETQHDVVHLVEDIARGKQVVSMD